MPITKADAQAFLNRWSMVRDVEHDELRTTSMNIKAKQLMSLMESRELFGADPVREQEVAEVRARWARLRQVLND